MKEFKLPTSFKVRGKLRMVIASALASCAILETGCTPDQVAVGVIAGTLGVATGAALAGSGRDRAYDDGYADGRRARRRRQVCRQEYFTDGFREFWRERCYFVDASTGGEPTVRDITPAEVRRALGFPSDVRAQLFMAIVGEFGRGGLHPAARDAGYTVDMIRDLMTTGRVDAAATTLEFARLADKLGVTSQHLANIVTAIRNEAAKQREEATSIQI